MKRPNNFNLKLIIWLCQISYLVSSLINPNSCFSQDKPYSTPPAPEVPVIHTPEPDSKIFPGIFLLIDDGKKSILVSVNNEGNALIPDMGKIKVLEMSTENLEKFLKSKTGKKFNVSMIPPTQSVAILGEVNKQSNVVPGQLFSNIAECYGFTNKANYKLTIFNSNTSKARVYNWYRLLDGHYKENPRTYPGDIVYVQQAGGWSLFQSMEPYLEVLSKISLTVIAVVQIARYGEDAGWWDSSEKSVINKIASGSRFLKISF